MPYSDDASLFYAQDSGIFRAHGLNVTFVPQASPVAVEASMASGTEQFGFVTTPVLINLNSKGVGVIVSPFTQTALAEGATGVQPPVSG